MTIRRRIATAALAVTIAFGGVALVPTAGTTASAQSPSAAGDLLAVSANEAFGDLTEFLWTGSSRASAEFAAERDEIATQVATRLGIDPARMVVAWRAADAQHQAALMAALSQLGVKYRGYMRKPGVGFDCSGLTSWAWEQAGLVIPRTSRLQIRAATPVTLETAQAGDLVYYPGHVMMYLGVDLAIVHAPQTGKTVSVDIVTKRHIKSLKVGDPS